MARFNFIGDYYAGQSINFDGQQTINWYREVNESGMGKSAAGLLPCPGLAPFFPPLINPTWDESVQYVPGNIVSRLNALWVCLKPNAGDPPEGDSVNWLAMANLLRGPGRGSIRVTQQILQATVDRIFFVLGAFFLELTPAGGIANGPFPIADDGGNSAYLAASALQVLFCSGGIAYVFDLNANTLTPVAALAGISISQVVYCKAFFLALVSNSQKILQSAPLDATTWPGADFTVVSDFPDIILSMLADHNELWLWGATKTEPYFADGGTPFAFSPVQGGMIEAGIMAAATTVRLDNSIFFWQQDERGAGVCVRIQGYLPQRVSNHAIEFLVQGFIKNQIASDAVSFSYQDQGHSFYVTLFPSANKTIVYDVATQGWHLRSWHNPATQQDEAHLSRCHVYGFGKHLVGSRVDGTIYEMAIPQIQQTANGFKWAFADDAGTTIRRVRRSTVLSLEGEIMTFDEFRMDAEMGLAPDPPIAPFIQAAPYVQVIILQDANGVLWNVTVTDVGTLQAAPAPVGSLATPLTLNDTILVNISWQLVVTVDGMLDVTAVAFSPANGQEFPLSTSGTQLATQLSVANGNLQVQAPIPFFRPSQGILRWSDDSGKTWTGEMVLSFGNAGEYSALARAYRLGSARVGRVFEFIVTDPVPWRIADAYLLGTGFQVQERLARKLSQQA